MDQLQKRLRGLMLFLENVQSTEKRHQTLYDAGIQGWQCTEERLQREPIMWEFLRDGVHYY
jgi:hypothetical protein